MAPASSPMRTVVILLLLANLTFFGYTRLDATSEGRGDPPAGAGAAGQDQAAAAAAGCRARAGQGRRARRRLPRMGAAHRCRAHAGARASSSRSRSGKLLTQRRSRDHDGVLGLRAAAGEQAPMPTGAPANSGRAGIGRGGGGRHRRPALRVRSAPSAPRRPRRARLDEVTGKGVANAKAGPRQQASPQTLLVIRDPQGPVVARIRELAATYPGSETKVGGCDKGRIDRVPPAETLAHDRHRHRRAAPGDHAARHRASPARCSSNTRSG